MRSLLTLGVALLFAAMVCPQDDAVKKEFARLQGKWKYEKVEAIDALARELAKHMTVEFQGTKALVTLDLKDEPKKTVTVAIKIDVTKTPKTIDMTPQDGPEKGKTSLGIYEIDGDTLRLHLGEPAGKRPTNFTYEAGKGSLSTLKRLPK